jgi:hypothetical protein
MSIEEIHMQHRKLLTALALGLGLSAGVSAAGLSASGNLVCAASSVIGCTSGPSCLQGTAASFDLPAVFMFVDFKKKTITGTEADGDKEVSPIRNQETTDSTLILQGIENQRGWSMAIDRQSGEMSVSSTGPDVDFMIFGACTAL